MARLRRDIERYNVRQIRSTMGLRSNVLGVVLDTSSKTIERWEKSGVPDTTPVHTLEELHRLKELCEMGVVVYGDNFKDFLRTPMRALTGRAPWRMLVAGDIDRVHELLAAVYEGDGF